MTSLDDVSDEDLVVVVRESNKELYSEIIRRYHIKLSHYLRKFIRNHDELEDVLQDVFIKAYRNLYGFDTHRKFSSWIYRIAHNEALNHIKKYKKESISLDEHEWEVIDESMDIHAKVEDDEFKKDIAQALACLNDKYREPLILYFFEQKTYEEISDILHVPRNTVGTLILRGKKGLKTILGHEKL